MDLMIPPAPGTQRSYRQKDQMTKTLPPTSSSVMALCGALYVLGALRKAPGTNYWAVNHVQDGNKGLIKISPTALLQSAAVLTTTFVLRLRVTPTGDEGQ